MVAELSLRAELLCSSGLLRTELSGTPVLGRCRFLFFTRIRPIRSCGLGRGTPAESWTAGTVRTHSVALHPHTPCLSSTPPYRVLIQGVNEQRIPKDRAAVLSHLGLLFRPVGTRSEVRGSQGKRRQFSFRGEGSMKGGCVSVPLECLHQRCL